MATTIKLTVSHAISYLTRPLVLSYPATTIVKLQLLLEANLTDLFAPSWVPTEPLRGSAHRCLTLSPDCLPPRPIYSACLAAGVQWFDWIALLGGREFDLFVDPACVSVRFGQKGSLRSQLVTVWSDNLTASYLSHSQANIRSQLKVQTDSRSMAQSQTLAQQLLAEDKEEDEELFAMLADEISAPAWRSPIRHRFPVTATPSSPLSAVSDHSRSSSRSSNSSSGFSFVSSDSHGSATTVSTPSSPNSKVDGNQPRPSRRERARQARIFVDASKTQVTPYEGGKTTVLTGGVMLGAAPPPPKLVARSRQVASNSYAIRV